ncbi:MAG: hypothetical protein IJ718_05360 [Paludibacteraceae bacterium]|nr:hypothetical protein [Paludibacteraceae bacterium]
MSDMLDKVILSPQKETGGVTLYLNGREFNAPVSMTRGQEVTISFRKKGMLGRIAGTNKTEQKLTVTESMEYRIPTLEWFKLVSYQMIQVKAESGTTVPYRLYINNREVTNGYGVYIRETDLEHVQIRVVGTGYAEFNDTVNFVGKDSVEIVLTKEGDELTLIIDGVEFTTRSPRTVGTISVEGHELYQMAGGKYRLQKKPGYLTNNGVVAGDKGIFGAITDWMVIGVIALICLIVGVVIGWAVFGDKEAKVVRPVVEATYPDSTIVEAVEELNADPEPMAIETKKADAPEPLEEPKAENSEVKEEEKATDASKEEPKAETPAPAPTAKAFKELYARKNNKGTELAERMMEEVPELQGLYRALAYYDRDKILNVYAPRVKSSDPNMAAWNQLVKAVRECPDVKFSSQGYAISGNQSHNITIEEYIKLIRKKQEEAKAKK